MQAESSLWGRKRVVGSKLKHDGTLGYISRGAARRSGLNPAGWHRYVPIAVVVAVIVIALAALGYAGGGANLDAMFKSPELAHAGTEVVEGVQTQTGVAPQRGIVAVASTIADAQKDEDEQDDGAETTHTNETTTTPSARQVASGAANLKCGLLAGQMSNANSDAPDVNHQQRAGRICAKVTRNERALTFWSRPRN